MSGRSDNAVKNRWYSLVRFYKKRDKQALEKFGDMQANSLSNKDLNGTVQDSNAAPIATLIQVGHFKAPGQEIPQKTEKMRASTMNNFLEYINESKVESESVKTKEANTEDEICHEEFEHTDTMVKLETNWEKRNLKRTDDIVHTIESIEFNKEAVSGSITFKEKHNVDYRYSEPSSVIKIQAESTPEPYLILEHCQQNEELWQITPFKRKHMNEEDINYTPAIKRASYLTPIKANGHALSSLASVSDSKEINLTEWFKTVEEQAPRLAVDTVATLEMLSPAPVRFSG